MKVTSKNGKTASPVGFVTFHSRAGAEAAKQDLQVEDDILYTPDGKKSELSLYCIIFLIIIIITY